MAARRRRMSAGDMGSKKGGFACGVCRSRLFRISDDVGEEPLNQSLACRAPVLLSAETDSSRWPERSFASPERRSGAQVSNSVSDVSIDLIDAQKQQWQVLRV
jgi:hypothetical protein